MPGHNIYLYIRNLKYCTFNTIFPQHNIHLVFSTYQHKYKWILFYRKTGFKRQFSRFLMYKYKNTHLICFEKSINTYIKTKNSLHTTRISSFEYIFIVFFLKNQMLNLHLNLIILFVNLLCFSLLIDLDKERGFVIIHGFFIDSFIIFKPFFNKKMHAKIYQLEKL